MNMIFKKVYTVSTKHKDKPRLFLQHLICKAAGWKPQETLYVAMKEKEQEIWIHNQPFSEENHQIHVSSRVSPSSGERRPLVDTARSEYASILSIKGKVEICIFKQDGRCSAVVVRPLRFQIKEEVAIEPPKDSRISMLNIAAGCGIGTASFQGSGYFTPVMEIERATDCCEVLQHNYPNSFIFSGDLRDCHEVVKSSFVLCTLPCVNHSQLGLGQENVFENLELATSKILRSANPSVILFENVPEWFTSSSFHLLKQLLQDQYPYWSHHEKVDSYDYGAVAHRLRTYSVAFQSKEQFQAFDFPVPPKRLRRRKLKDYMDPKGTAFEWKNLGKWMASFNSKKEKGNSWADRSLAKTFVTGDATEIACIPARYRSQCSSNSYVLHEDGEQFRFLTISEIRRILGVEEDFEFPPHTPLTRIYEMLGQSIDGRLFRIFANSIATSFFRVWNLAKERCRPTLPEAFQINSGGQLELCI